MLLGKDIILRDRLLDLARSFRAMLQSQQDYLIAALKTLQAVVSCHISVPLWARQLFAVAPRG